MIDLHDDLLGEDAIRHYFDFYYYQQSRRWDSKDIVSSDCFNLDGKDPSLPFKFQYQTVAANFRLIDDWQVPVIIPYDDRARALIAELRNTSIPLHRDLLRGLQRYTVQISPRIRDENLRSFEALRDEQFHVLSSNKLNYSYHFGLTFESSDIDPKDLIL